VAARVVVLGRVVGAHGVRGQVRIRILGDGPDNLLALTAVALADPARGPDDPAARRHEIEGGSQARPGEVRLALSGIHDREAAEALRGLLLVAPAEALPALPEGDHYWFELVGCRVETAGGVALGTVRELWDIGAHDVLVVEAPGGERRLIPTAGPAIREIDAAAGRIVVEELPGLLDPQPA
jgi:16S rRNA processing protein RimM